MHTLVHENLKLDIQAYQPSVLFINGSYFGIHNIREKLNEKYLATYHNVDIDNLDLIYMDIRDTTIEVLRGDLVDFNFTLDFIHNNDLALDENYSTVKEMIDIENYVDYLIGNLFYSNTSWHHNVKIWKEKAPGDKWKWLFYDLDRGMAQYYLANYSVIEDLDTTDLFFPHLNQNEDFKALLLNRLSGFMNSAFEKERVIYFIDSLKDKIADEIPDHSLRWKDECDPEGNCGIQSMQHWIDDINNLKGYTDEAQVSVRDHMSDFYSLDGIAGLTIHIDNPEMGKVFIENVEYQPEGQKWDYFKGLPIKIVAIPNDPFRFLEWEDYSFNDTIYVNLEDDLTLFAHFGNSCELPSVIAEDMTIGIECASYLTQGDLFIEEGASLTVEPGTHIFITPGDSIHVNGQLIVNGTAGHPVILRSTGSDHHWGCIYAPDGRIFLDYTEFINCKAAVVMNAGEVEMKNSTVHFSPYFFSDIVSIHKAKTTLINNLFHGPDDEGKSDVIDCDEIEFGWIENNTITGTTDDGIDVGTGSSGINILRNKVYHCGSMGISVGEYTLAHIEGNVVAGCEAGIQVHTEAIAEIDHNTLFQNDIGVQCYHYDYQPGSGGHAIVTNSILSGSLIAAYELFDNSTISFAYSLTDTEAVNGIGNLHADPLFQDTVSFDFRLQESSPCIDSGDPDFPLDPDGSRTDMGAIYFDHGNAIIEKHTQEEIFLFPNPATDYMNCFLVDTSTRILEVEIFNQQGQRVIYLDKVLDDRVRIRTSLLQHGIYHISLRTTENKRIGGKFVVLKFNKE